jgi:predicted permease
MFGALKRGRSDGDLEEELRLHLELAADEARKNGEVRAARIRAGGASQAMDALRDQRGLPWFDALVSDVVFGWRQLRRHRGASLAAVLSLGLAIGATTAAFRLVDSVLLRPLPVAEPDRLFFVARTLVNSENRPDYEDDFDYPTFRKYAAVLSGQAEAMVVGMTAPQQVTFAPSGEPERISRQYVSGNVFPIFGLQPALGRLIAPSDDVTPGAHPVAVISYDYWTRRFARSPDVLGRSFTAGPQRYEIVGVSPKSFTGTEPGRIADVFIPSQMNVQALNSPGWSWFRMWVRPGPGVTAGQIGQMLQTTFRDEHREHLKRFPADTPKQRIEAFLKEDITLFPAASGASGTQKTFRRPLLILGALVALVLLVACTNVANLLTAQAMTRAREMALRVSLGAERWRLIRLVLVESALLAICAAAVGALIAWWSPPFVVSMLTTIDNPVRMNFDVDWRTLAFLAALTLAVTGLFGLVPALRASSVAPVGALKGGEDPHAHRRVTKVLVGAQMALCVFVLFVAGLFAATLERLTSYPLGYSHQRVVVVATETRGKTTPLEAWIQVADQLRAAPGVESVAFAGWPLMSGNGWTISARIPGGSVEPRPSQVLDVSPGFLETMKIDLIAGRDFRPGDAQPRVDDKEQPRPGVAIVNETFAKTYFNGENPVGRWVSIRTAKDVEVRLDIIGWARDATYRSIREPRRPGIYLPIENRNNAVFLVRTAGDPLALVSTLRAEVSRANPDFRVRMTGMQSQLVQQQMVRERLLATLSGFFAAVTLLLAAIGLYGVLNAGVIQYRREIGIRMALGARAGHVVRGVAAGIFVMVALGSAIGLAGGLAFGRLIEGLLFQIKASDPTSIVVPLLMLAAAAGLATLAPAIRAVRIDPAQTLRSE